MVDSEFADFWIEVKTVMPSLRVWLLGLDKLDERPEEHESSYAMLKHWREIMRDVLLSDAREVLATMATSQSIETTNAAREAFGSSVRHACKQKEYERQQQRQRDAEARRAVQVQVTRPSKFKLDVWALVDMKPDERKEAIRKSGLRVDERAYSCLACHDSFWVLVWYSDDLLKMLRDPEWKPTAKPATSACRCSCPRADGYWSPRNKIGRYDQSEHCIYHENEPLAANIEYAASWLGSWMAKKLQEKNARMEREGSLF